VVEKAILIAHADWSTRSGKRWFSCAHKTGATYLMEAPGRVGETKSFIEGLVRRAGPSVPVLAGFDFPIGVPSAFARSAGIESFKDELPHFGGGRWDKFYEIARTAKEISQQRPFYPARPGGTSRRDLVDRLGLRSFEELLRQCDRACDGRPNACALFWTLGGNQVGRAAISGWRDVLAPALSSSTFGAALWPFDGHLSELVATSGVVMVETYPAEACRVIGIPFPGRGWSKRNRAHRSIHAKTILAWCEQHHVGYTEQLRREVLEGFSDDPDGEDRFDAVLGLIAMVAVTTGAHPCDAPCTREVRQIEGWILGQPVAASAG
jgi:hypothetical protein